MVWLIALACLGFVGFAGYSYGPVRGAAAFLGLVFGLALASPLSILTKHLLPVLGLVHPIWGIFVPQAIAFFLVLIIFMVAGEVRHQKIAFHFKYKADDSTRIAWQRMFDRVGLSVGFLNGAICFLLLMVPIYACGYFTTEALTTDDDPFLPRFLTNTRAELVNCGLDYVIAAYDPTPPQLYKAADIASLVLRNPLTEARLAHYPPVLQLGEQPEFKIFDNDLPFQELIQTQARPAEIIQYPKVFGVLTNAVYTDEICGMLKDDLDDLQDYLMTGQSPKFDPQQILGVWVSDRAGTMAEARRQQPGLTPLEFRQKRKQDLFPIIDGLSLTGIPNGQMLLKKLTPNTPSNPVVAAGTWKQESSGYQVTLPGSHPETTDVKIEEGNKLLLPKDGFVLVFDKEM